MQTQHLLILPGNTACQSARVAHCSPITLSAVCNYAGSTITCPNALTIKVVGSNVRVDVTNIRLTDNSSLINCSPALVTPKVLDPTNPSATAITCSVVSPVLTQYDYEAGNLTWGVVAEGVVARGGNASLDSDYTVSFTRTLQQVRKFQLGIKRMPWNDTMGNVVSAGECVSASHHLEVAEA